jgi:hypothetical protein
MRLRTPVEASARNGLWDPFERPGMAAIINFAHKEPTFQGLLVRFMKRDYSRLKCKLPGVYCSNRRLEMGPLQFCWQMTRLIAVDAIYDMPRLASRRPPCNPVHAECGTRSRVVVALSPSDIRTD